MSVDNQPPTEQFESRREARSAAGTEQTGLTSLREGDVFVPSVSWYDWSNKPTTFKVVREASESARQALRDGLKPVGSLTAVGADGEKYVFYLDNVHVEKDGTDAGTTTGIPYKVTG